MKLKDNLARLYRGQFLFSHCASYEAPIVYDTDLDLAYLAGFEKAREMASELFFHSTSPNGRSIYKLVSNLGEEDVE